MAWVIDTGKSRKLLSDGQYLVGRDPDCGIVVNAADVSRRHAELIVSGVELTVRDLGSQNGTFISGERLAAHSPVRLTAAAEVVFGTTSVGFAPQVEQPVRQSEPEPGSTRGLSDPAALHEGGGRPTAAYHQRPRMEPPSITSVLNAYFPGTTPEQIWSLVITLIALPILGILGALLSEHIWATFWIGVFTALPWATGFFLSALYYVTGNEGARKLGRTGLIIAWLIFAIAELIMVRRIDAGISSLLP